jgi:hypothetical protein
MGAALWTLRNGEDTGYDAATIKRLPVEAENGERIVDFARRSLEGEEQGLTVEELCQRMKQAGWNTISKKPANVVNSKLYNYPDIVTKTDEGRWILRESIMDEPVMGLEESATESAQTT